MRRRLAVFVVDAEAARPNLGPFGRAIEESELRICAYPDERRRPQDLLRETMIFRESGSSVTSISRHRRRPTPGRG